MLRVFLVSSVLFAAAAPAAHGRLVYHRTHTRKIVAARDDGSHASVIARGRRALIAPSGKRAIIATRARHGADFDLRLVSTRGGRPRMLLPHAEFNPGDQGPEPSWAPDSRHIVAGDADSGEAFLLEAKKRNRRDLDRRFYAGGSFSPDSSRLVLALSDLFDENSGVFTYGLRSRRFHAVFDGDTLRWGQSGIAYWDNKGLKVRSRPTDRPRLLAAHPSDGPLQPVDWSADGNRLLAEIVPFNGPRHAVLLDLSSGMAHTVPVGFSQITDLSKNGRRVLGVIGGNVVAVAPDGSVRILASNADEPSWNR
jgi:hypothetical protein